MTADRRRVLLLVIVLVAISVGVGATALASLYRAALDQQRERLVETAKSQARFIEAVARFDRLHSADFEPGGPFAATLLQIRDAHERFQGFGETGEFTLARREGDQIFFLLSHRHERVTTPPPVRISTGLAEPMMRALEGEAGTVIGLDYRGEKVLAAFEPVAELGLGIVAKIDLGEVRRPYLEAALQSAGVGVWLVILGVILFLRTANPLVRRVEESERRYRSFYSSAPLAFVIWDREGRVVEWNEQAEKVFGWTLEEARGRLFVELVVPEDRRPPSAEVVASVLNGGLATRTIEENITKDGTVLSCEWSNAVQYDAEGRIAGVASVGLDITERQRSVDALQSRTAYLDELIENAPQAIALLDIDDRIERINPEFERLFGYPAEEAIGRPINELLVPGSLQDESSELSKQVLDGKPVAIESRRKTRDGREIDVAVLGAPVRVGERQVGIYAIYQDIGQRKAVEAALRSSEQRFRSLVENAPDGIFLLDVEGRHTYVNSVGCEMLGYPCQSLHEKTLFDVVRAADREVVEQGFRVLKSTGRFTREVELLRADDSSVPVLLNAVALPGSGFLAFCTDFTEQRSLEVKLFQAQKMEAIGMLAGGIAHDFNNQLAGILGNAELLAELLEDPDLREYATSIVDSAEHSANLTQQLLAFARRGQVERVTVDVHATIREAVALLSRSIGRSIVIETQLEADPPTTLGDPSQLQSALLNLGLNARDAMPDGGELKFSAAVTEVDAEQTRRLPFDMAEGRYLRVAVSDTGVGIDRETQRRVFEPFFTTKEPGKGTGMGLASVYGTVKRHGGAILIESEPGRGTVVEIYLPSNELPTPHEAPTAPPVEPAAVERILVVDDEESVREMLARMLHSLGYEATTCRDGGDAVEAYRRSEQAIDLVILDMMMPGMDGRQTFRALREIDPEVKVVLSSGFSLAEEAQAILDEGVKAFIQKPYRRRDLEKTLRSVLAG